MLGVSEYAHFKKWWFSFIHLVIAYLNNIKMDKYAKFDPIKIQD